MKQTYVKPLLLFESFSLTQTIARDCGDTHSGTLGESNHYSEVSCQWKVGGLTIFIEGAPCMTGPTTPDDEFEINGLCYNNPDGGQQIFSSN